MVYEIKNIGLLSNFDWTNLQTSFQEVWDLCESGSLNDKKYFEKNYRSNIYSLGNHDGLVESFSLTNGMPWRTWTGPSLERLIPWTASVRHRLEQSGLNFINFSYTRHLNAISAHVDGKTDKEKDHAVQGHCNINFITRCDHTEAYTWVKDHSGQEDRYPSTPLRGWLLRTDLLHGVSTLGTRESFQIKFHSPFDHVKQWLEDNPRVFDLDLDYISQ